MKLPRRALLRLLPVLAVVVGLGASAAPASAACNPIQVLLGCKVTVAPPPVAPDVGGNENIDQPVPPPGRYFGWSLGIEAPSEMSVLNGITAMVASGTTHYREAISWHAWAGTTSASQPVPPEYSLPVGQTLSWMPAAATDRHYLALTAAGITPVFVVYQAPFWASRFRNCGAGLNWLDSSQCPSGWTKGPYHVDRAFNSQFERFVTAVAKRYPAAVIEGYNEPDYESTIAVAGKVTPAQAVVEQCALYRGVKAARPDQTVLSPAIYQPAYVSSYLSALGSSRCHDAMSFHLYPGITTFGAGTKLATKLGDYRKIRAQYGQTDPIWITETGATTSNPQWPETEEMVSDGLRRLYNKLSQLPDIKAIMVHTLRDGPFPGALTAGTAEHGFGYVGTDWVPKPRFCHLVRMSGHTYPGCS